MNPDELRALADAIVYRDSLAIARAADYLRACADAQPVAWTDRHTAVTRFALWRFINEALSRSAHAAQKGSYEPVENVAKYQDDAKTAEEARAMLAAAPAAPQADQSVRDLLAIIHRDDGHHTESGPDEAQIEARDALLDFISENGTASEGVQHYLDRYVRAALAAKDEK